jgi:hypothetical protein
MGKILCINKLKSETKQQEEEKDGGAHGKATTFRPNKIEES